MSRPLALLLLLGIALTAVTAAPRRRGTADQLEHLSRKLRELEGSLSDGDATNQDVDMLLQDFVDKLDENDVHLLQDMPSKTPLLQKALHDHKDHPSPPDQRRAQTFARRGDDPLEDFLNTLSDDDRVLMNDSPSRLDLLEQALALPPVAPGVEKPKPEALPSTEAPVKPSTTPTQIPLSTKPEQPSTTSPVLPGEKKTEKRCVGGNCYKFGKDLVSFSKRSVQSGPLADFLKELLEEDKDIAKNIKAKLNFLRRAIDYPGEMDSAETAPARRGSNDDFDSYMGNLEQQDSDLLNRFQSRLHLVREALQLKPTKENARRSEGFGDFVEPEQLPPAKPSQTWGEGPIPDQQLGIVEESRCIGGNCEVQRPVSERSRKMAAAILKSSDSNPRLRALLERLRQERQHK